MKIGTWIAGVLTAGLSVGCCFPADPTPQRVWVDEDGNDVLEPGETAALAPWWRNNNQGPECDPLFLSGSLDSLTGPGAADYVIVDSTAQYPEIPPGGQHSCRECYAVTVSAASGRPATHWDATARETVAWYSLAVEGMGLPRAAGLPAVSTVSTDWTLHVGGSFEDVPASHPFYRHVETILHVGLTNGCEETAYCPDGPISRAQMAAFLLRARHGASFLPPMCTGIFDDVPCPDGFAVRWIEQLFREELTAGCGPSTYCPDRTVTRSQMAALLLKAEHGGAYVPDPCVGLFEDVPCPGPFADWIERLHREGVTAGCSADPVLYCPDAPNTRGQMAAFLVRTFELALN